MVHFGFVWQATFRRDDPETLVIESAGSYQELAALLLKYGNLSRTIHVHLDKDETFDFKDSIVEKLKGLTLLTEAPKELAHLGIHFHFPFSGTLEQEAQYAVNLDNFLRNLGFTIKSEKFIEIKKMPNEFEVGGTAALKDEANAWTAAGKQAILFKTILQLYIARTHQVIEIGSGVEFEDEDETEEKVVLKKETVHRGLLAVRKVSTKTDHKANAIRISIPSNIGMGEEHYLQITGFMDRLSRAKKETLENFLELEAPKKRLHHNLLMSSNYNVCKSCLDGSGLIFPDYVKPKLGFISIPNGKFTVIVETLAYNSSITGKKRGAEADVTEDRGNSNINVARPVVTEPTGPTYTRLKNLLSGRPEMPALPAITQGPNPTGTLAGLIANQSNASASNLFAPSKPLALEWKSVGNVNTPAGKFNVSRFSGDETGKGTVPPKKVKRVIVEDSDEDEDVVAFVEQTTETKKAKEKSSEVVDLDSDEDDDDESTMKAARDVVTFIDKVVVKEEKDVLEKIENEKTAITATMVSLGIPESDFTVEFEENYSSDPSKNHITALIWFDKKHKSKVRDGQGKFKKSPGFVYTLTTEKK